MCVCTLKLEVVATGCRIEVQLQVGYKLQTSDTHARTHTRIQWFVKVYGGNAVVRIGNAPSANLPSVSLQRFLSLEVESNKLHLPYFELPLLSNVQ